MVRRVTDAFSGSRSRSREERLVCIMFASAILEMLRSSISFCIWWAMTRLTAVASALAYCLLVGSRQRLQPPPDRLSARACKEEDDIEPYVSNTHTSRNVP